MITGHGRAAGEAGRAAADLDEAERWITDPASRDGRTSGELARRSRGEGHVGSYETRAGVRWFWKATLDPAGRLEEGHLETRVRDQEGGPGRPARGAGGREEGHLHRAEQAHPGRLAG